MARQIEATANQIAIVSHKTAKAGRRYYGDKIRCGDEAACDHMVYEWYSSIFYAETHSAPRKAWNGWWNMPMAEWAWKGDAAALGA